MAKPEIHFTDSEEELQYGVKVLVESGFTPQQIERIRDKIGVGPGKIPYDKETVGQRRYMVQELLVSYGLKKSSKAKTFIVLESYKSKWN
mgnify:CR=1 FL=1